MNRARLSIQERVGAIERRVRRMPPVRVLMSVLDSFNAAGGGLLASGLAFSALFAVVPGLLLLASVLVILIDDPETRRRVIDWVIDQVPPLEEVATSVVNSVANSARVGSIIGFIGFVWGASGFYLAIDGAINRFFPAPRGRDPLMGRVRGVIATAIVVVAVLAAFATSTAISVVNTVLNLRADGLLPILSPLVAVGVAWLVCLACYLLLPVRPPHWRAALVPAIVAGTAIGLLTSLFGVLAPLLVGGFTGLGVIASVFIALVWLNWLFQAVLLGAAYARQRDVHQRHRDSEVARIF
jgi:YihY family inner membrane protein